MRRFPAAVLGLVGVVLGAASAAASDVGPEETLAALCAWLEDAGPAVEETPTAPADAWVPTGERLAECLRENRTAPPELPSEEVLRASFAALVADRPTFEAVLESAGRAPALPPSCARFLDCLARPAPGASAGIRDELRSEFERLCGLVPVAAGLSREELAAAADAAVRLDERLAVVEDREVKILRLRLRRCRELFEYLIALADREAEAS